MVKDKGKHTFIDKVQVRYVSDDDKYWAELKNFGHKYVHVPEHYLRDYDRLLMGGIWAQVDLKASVRRRGQRKTQSVWIEGLKPSNLPHLTLQNIENVVVASLLKNGLTCFCALLAWSRLSFRATAKDSLSHTANSTV